MTTALFVFAIVGPIIGAALGYFSCDSRTARMVIFGLFGGALLVDFLTGALAADTFIATLVLAGFVYTYVAGPDEPFGDRIGA